MTLARLFSRDRTPSSDVEGRWRATEDRPCVLSFRVHSDAPVVRFRIEGEDLRMDPGDGSGYRPIRSDATAKDDGSAPDVIAHAYALEDVVDPAAIEACEREKPDGFESGARPVGIKVFEVKIVGAIDSIRAGSDGFDSIFDPDRFDSPRLCGIRF